VAKLRSAVTHTGVEANKQFSVSAPHAAQNAPMSLPALDVLLLPLCCCAVDELTLTRGT
jgi:hypothetical protein